MTLAPSQIQPDFSAGIFRSVARHLIPTNGLYDCINGLLNDDGAIYKRGGSAVLSTANAGSAGGRFIWDGQLEPGARTIFADTADFYVLDGSEGVVTLGGAGVSASGQAAAFKDLLFIPPGYIYGGSRKTSNYSTGTVTATNGSTTLTGSGTSWTANVDVGMLFRVSGERVYVVASIDSNTQITLTEAYEGTTGAGKNYTLKMIEDATTPYKTATAYTVAGERLIAVSGDGYYYSDWDDPHTFGTTSFEKMPEGVSVLGAIGLENNLYTFTTGGVWANSNMHLERTDDFGNPTRMLRQISTEMILLSGAGIAMWSGGVLVPASDGVWYLHLSGVDQLTNFEKISKPIDSLYSGYVRSGYHAGQATVYNSHYILPILNSSEEVQDTLVCRLDRPTKARGQTVYPWTRLDGEGANCAAWTQRVSSTGTRQPKLLGLGRASSGSYICRVLNCSYFFAPAAAYKNDHDGTTHEWQIETRDFPTGRLNINLVKWLRATYRMLADSGDNPRIAADWSNGAAQTSGDYWGTMLWGTGVWTSDAGSEWYAMAGTAGSDDGRVPKRWSLFGRNARTRFVRFRVRSTSPVAELTLRTLEVFTRQSRRI